MYIAVAWSMTWLVMWRRTQARPREHVSVSEVAIDSTLLSLTQAFSYVLLGSQASASGSARLQGVLFAS